MSAHWPLLLLVRDCQTALQRIHALLEDTSALDLPTMALRPSLLYNADNTPLSLTSRMTFSTTRPARSYAKQEADSEDSTSSIPYVTDILSYSSFYIAVNTENIIKFLHKETLKTLREIRIRNDTIIRSIAKIDGPEEALMVTLENGSVAIYDVRDQSTTPRMVLKGPQPAPCLCASSSKSSTYIASGTELYHHEATIRIHDTRQPSQALHVYSETHSDDISSLSFHPEEDHLLLSGAMDGLISTIDVRIQDEDDAILHTANVGASLSKIGWMPLPTSPASAPWGGVFGLTNMETLSVYDAVDELSVVKEFGDVREMEHPQWQTHYVIDCQGLPGGLALTSGTREGALAIMQVPLQGDWTLEQILREGHSDIVRSCRLDLTNGSAVTCGEDGEVCLWSASASSSSSVNGGDSQMQASASLKASNERESKSSRYAPY